MRVREGSGSRYPPLELRVRGALEEVRAVTHLLLGELDFEDIRVRRQRRVLLGLGLGLG